MKNLKVKLITGVDLPELEQKINEFLKNAEGELIEITYFDYHSRVNSRNIEETIALTKTVASLLLSEPKQDLYQNR